MVLLYQFHTIYELYPRSPTVSSRHASCILRFVQYARYRFPRSLLLAFMWLAIAFTLAKTVANPHYYASVGNADLV
jgi:hypothetical protein